MAVIGMPFFDNNDAWAIIYTLFGKQIPGSQDYLSELVIFEERLAKLAMVSNSKKAITDNKAKDSTLFQKPQTMVDKKAIGIIDSNIFESLQKRLPMGVKIGAMST